MSEEMKAVESEVKAEPVAAPASSGKKKKYTEMTEQELLIEILKAQRKQTRRSGFSAFFSFALCVIFAAALLIIIPPVLQTLNNANEIMTQSTEILTEANTAVSEINVLLTSAEGTMDELDGVLTNVNTLVVDNSDYLTQSMESLSSIDFEGLNASIQALQDIVTPLAKMMKVFN